MLIKSEKTPLVCMIYTKLIPRFKCLLDVISDYGPVPFVPFYLLPSSVVRFRFSCVSWRTLQCPPVESRRVNTEESVIWKI